MAQLTNTEIKYFIKADEPRFRWLTTNSYIKLKESELLSNISAHSQGKVLEIGCGEGANFLNLDSNHDFGVGIDLFYDKIRFAADNNKKIKFLCADAIKLPFTDDSFDLVFCRDVLHHMETKEEAIKEMFRVCKKGKKIVLLEANGRNVFWKLFATLIKAEEKVKKNKIELYNGIITKGFSDKCSNVEIGLVHSCTFSKLLAHYKFGWQALGESKIAKKIMENLEKLSKKYSNKNNWAYIFCVITKK